MKLSQKEKDKYDHLKWATRQKFHIKFSETNPDFFLGFYVIKFVANIITQILNSLLIF